VAQLAMDHVAPMMLAPRVSALARFGSGDRITPPSILRLPRSAGLSRPKHPWLTLPPMITVTRDDTCRTLDFQTSACRTRSRSLQASSPPLSSCLREPSQPVASRCALRKALVYSATQRQRRCTPHLCLTHIASVVQLVGRRHAV
jgi:hypothetical protein